MRTNSFKQSAPGSLFLLGEYAVLQNGLALVCAIDQRIHVELTPRTDNQIEIISSLGRHITTLTQLEIVPPFQFVLATLKKYQKKLKSGCTLKIESEFSEKMGLASSAAVTVATLAVIAEWLKFSYSSLQLIQQARNIVQTVQGMGSGADVAACVLGGIIEYRKKPLMAKKIDTVCPLHLIYSGNKTPTVIAVNQVKKRFAEYPKLYQQLLHAIDECAQQGLTALKNKNTKAFAELMTIQQGLMNALGVNTPLLQNIIEELLTEPTILAAKISGSGLGDSIIALGTLRDDYVSRFAEQGVKRIPITLATEGVRREKI